MRNLFPLPMIAINAFLVLYLAFYIFSVFLHAAVELLNISHLRKRGHVLPPEFQALIVERELHRINAYSLNHSIVDFVAQLTKSFIFLCVLLSGLLPWLAETLEKLPFLLRGLVYFGVLGFFSALLDLPFQYYRIFVIEEKYGFNTRTLRLWTVDCIKSLLLGALVAGILITFVLAILQHGGREWWLLAWFAFFSFELLLMLVYPLLVAPWFNRFTPVEQGSLTERIRRLVEGEGFEMKAVLRMDASRRSRHSNAYFSGIGKSKRIVLYDTLLGFHDDEEIIAVLAHELGHLKKKHLTKQIFLIGAASLIFLYAASLLMNWEVLYTSFGFKGKESYLGLLLVGFLWEPLGILFSPIALALSRRFEREADSYAAQVHGSAESLIRALKKMARDNFSNLQPHPLYVLFSYSHPPLLERIRRLQKQSQRLGSRAPES